MTLFQFHENILFIRLRCVYWKCQSNQDSHYKIIYICDLKILSSTLKSTKWTHIICNLSNLHPFYIEWRCLLITLVCLVNKISKLKLSAAKSPIRHHTIFAVQFISQVYHYAHITHISFNLWQYLFVYLWKWSMFI